eukprot:gene12361-26006_t
MIAFVLISVLSLYTCDSSKRLYAQQFPPGAEHLRLPSIVALSIHVGPVKWAFMPFTMESIRLNPSVQFVLISIMNEGKKNSKKILHYAKTLPNFRLHSVSTTEFSKLVFNKLNLTIKVENTKAWHHKICDYKPTLAYLFPELLDINNSSGKQPAFWAFVDIDLVWGNISRFSHLFHENDVVRAAPGATGVGMFYRNEAWSRELFLNDPRFVVLLKNITYYNMDEFGKATNEGYLEASHSISDIQDRELPRLHKKINEATWRDKLMMEYVDTLEWAGPALWQHGSIKVIKGSPEFPPGREILCYHRPERDLNGFESFPTLAGPLFEDMISYGYFLPHWIPVISRFSCLPNNWLSTLHAWGEYSPYSEKCFNGQKQSLDAHVNVTSFKGYF